MLELLRGKPKKAVHKMIRAAYMNLAYQITPTIVTADWATDPADLATLTDDNLLSHLATPGICNLGSPAEEGIKIDLGQLCEVYEINVWNTAGAGFKSNNASNAGTIKIKTSPDDSTWTQRGDTQTPAGTAYEDSTLQTTFEGASIRYVLIEFDTDASYTLTCDISEIEVFGS